MDIGDGRPLFLSFVYEDRLRLRDLASRIRGRPDISAGVKTMPDRCNPRLSP